MTVSKERIHEVLKSEYDREAWKQLVTDLFQGLVVRWEHTPIVKELGTKVAQYRAKTLVQLGAITLADDRQVLVFEGEVQNTVISEARVGLRDLIKGEIIPNVQDAAIAVFFSKEQQEWRFTFLSKFEEFDGTRFKKTETAPKRYTYVLGPTESCRTAKERFNELGRSERRLSDVITAFSVSKIGDEFFSEYKKHYAAFTEYLASNTKFRKDIFGIVKRGEEEEKPIRDFVKKLLGRVVFLYFLQKKGWLGVPENDDEWTQGDRQFLANLLEACERKDDFYQDYLCPLFFRSLNNARGRGSGVVFKAGGKSFGRVPYLNGGLFDEDFEGVTQLSFRRNLFEELLTFFDSYNFTIVEDSPEDREIAVDPEVLGHVFESLIEDNKAKGTFYTPKEVVHFMTQESLFLHLRIQLGIAEGHADEQKALLKLVREKEASTAYVRRNASRINALLDELKICDPAIGSGAFPMGLLLEIFQMKAVLFGELAQQGLATHFDAANVKEHIISCSIFGVDLDKGAIDIACLRFWLSLIVDIKIPRPLPNFDYTFMQGNSLREGFEGIDLSQMFKAPEAEQGNLFKEPEPSYGLEEVQELADRLYHSHDAEKATIREKLHRIEKRWISDRVTEQVHAKENAIQELKRKLKLGARNLSGKSLKDYEAKCNKELKALEGELEVLNETGGTLKSMRRYEKPYFLWHLYFGHVFKQGGFDIVVANPPYLRDSSYADVKERYGLGSNDLYGMFTAMAVKKLLKAETGVMAFITSDTWLTIGSHWKLRELLLQRELHKVVRLHRDTFTATVNACVFTLVNKTVRPPEWWTCHQNQVLPAQAELAKSLRKAEAEQAKAKSTKQGKTMELEAAHAAADKLKEAEAIKQELAKDWMPKSHDLIVADLTNQSTQTEIAAFRRVMYALEEHVGEVNTHYAVYSYPQHLVFTHSHLPVFAASPKLFGLMNDLSCATELRTIGNKEVVIRLLPMNDGIVELVRFGDASDVKQGLATGDNGHYLYQRSQARGNYRDIEEYTEFLLTEADLEKVRSDETIRLKVVSKGIHKTKAESGFDKDCWFGGRYIAPYDKGGESDTSEGWLPNYHVPTEYFIDWSTAAVKRLKTYTIANRIRDRKEAKAVKETHTYTTAAVIRNPSTYFQRAITFSRSGMYAPTFRTGCGAVYDSEGCQIYSPLDMHHTLGVLPTKVIRYLSKAFLNHTVHFQIEDLKDFSYPVHQQPRIGILVEAIIEKQRANQRYNYIQHEQREVEALVYELFHLNDDDINEVETWFARTYPKLARYADIRPQPDFKKRKELERVVRQTITQSENKWVEFKSSLRWDIKQGQSAPHIEHSAMKTVAAFLNSQGGTLLIGVDDNDQVLGLETTDYRSFNRQNKLTDSWRKHWDTLLRNYLGDAAHDLVTCELVKLEEGTVAIVHVEKPSPKPVWLTNKSKSDAEEMYIRRMASTVELKGKELEKYLKG